MSTIVPTELPALVLSTTKAFRFRPFEMSIILSQQWMLENHINSEMVLAAGFNTKCCFENNPTEPVGPCKKCGSKKKTLISIKTSSKTVFGPHEIAPGILKFTFNLCRSHCTSSRDHLRSRVLLVVEGLGDVALRSPPMILRSREKGALPASICPIAGGISACGGGVLASAPAASQASAAAAYYATNAGLPFASSSSPSRAHSSESDEEDSSPIAWRMQQPPQHNNNAPLLTASSSSSSSIILSSSNGNKGGVLVTTPPPILSASAPLISSTAPRVAPAPTTTTLGTTAVKISSSSSSSLSSSPTPASVCQQAPTAGIINNTTAAGLDYSSWYFAQQEAPSCNSASATLIHHQSRPSFIEQQQQQRPLRNIIESSRPSLPVVTMDQQPSLLQQAVQRDPAMLALLQPSAQQSYPHSHTGLFNSYCEAAPPAYSSSSSSSPKQTTPSLPSLSELFPNSGFGLPSTSTTSSSSSLLSYGYLHPYP